MLPLSLIDASFQFQSLNAVCFFVGSEQGCLRFPYCDVDGCVSIIGNDAAKR